MKMKPHHVHWHCSRRYRSRNADASGHLPKKWSREDQELPIPTRDRNLVCRTPSPSPASLGRPTRVKGTLIKVAAPRLRAHSPARECGPCCTKAVDIIQQTVSDLQRSNHSILGCISGCVRMDTSTRAPCRHTERLGHRLRTTPHDPAPPRTFRTT